MAEFMTAPPESLGIPSESILELINGVEEHALQTHGVIVARHGLAAAEGYWKPYAADRFHRMYSVSKSFTATAIGLLADEGRIRVTDRLADLLPEYVPENAHEYFSQITVRDLLMMAAPSSPVTYVDDGPDWAKSFCKHPCDHPPGTQFAYDTGATVALCAIVEKLTGQSMFESMRAKLFDPIGFSKDAFCVESPDGRSWGGSGVNCTLRDLARFAEVYLNGGVWNGRRLLSREWVEEATALQLTIGDSPFVPGYGYQIWRHEGGFWFNGMGSQYAFCFPDKSLIVATVGETMLSGEEAKWYWLAAVKKLASRLSDSSLPENRRAEGLLRDRLSSLTLRLQEGAKDSPMRNRIDGRKWRLENNALGIPWLKLSFHGGEGILDYENAQGVHAIRFGFGAQVEGLFPEKVYGRRIWTYQDRGFVCYSSAGWPDERTLRIRVQVVDINCGTVVMTFAFKEIDGRTQLSLRMRKAGEYLMSAYDGFAGGVMVP
jgi:CubicO group peptidase (beta-lactamase class C family)